MRSDPRRGSPASVNCHQVISYSLLFFFSFFFPRSTGDLVHAWPQRNDGEQAAGEPGIAVRGLRDAAVRDLRAPLLPRSRARLFFMEE